MEAFGHELESGVLQVMDEDTQMPVLDPETTEYKTVPVRWSDNKTFKGNSLIVDMRSKEAEHGTSYSNDAHAVYMVQKIIDFFGTYRIAEDKGEVRCHQIPGNILAVCPYTAQIELITWGLESVGDTAITSWGEVVFVDPSRWSVRTHLGAQGFEASVVIVGYVRSRSPGHTGDPQINNVMLSRARLGQILLLNNSVLERVDSYAPQNRTLTKVFRYHRKRGAVIDLDHKDMIRCDICYGLGHISSKCTKVKDPMWRCPFCSQPHHPVNCKVRKRNNVPDFSDKINQRTKPIAPKTEAQTTPAEDVVEPSTTVHRREPTLRDKTLRAAKVIKRKVVGEPIWETAQSPAEAADVPEDWNAPVEPNW